MCASRLAWAIGALILSSGSLFAQGRPASNRSGQWLGFGLGLGMGRVSCAICVTNRNTSIAGYFKAGGTLNRRFLLGVEGDGWTRAEDDVDEHLLGLAVQLFYYPNPRKRLFYKVGLGAMLHRMDDGPTRLSTTAFGPTVGAGFDLPMSPTVSFTPFASVFVASLGGKIKANGETVRNDVSLMLIQLGVGVTWH